MNVKNIGIVMLVGLVAMLSGCAGGPAVSYQDATSVETLDTSFGSTDLQMIAEKLVQDMLASPRVAQITSSGPPPVLYVDKIQNKTMEHIDLESVTNTIQAKLTNSGKFNFVDMSRLGELKQQQAYQHESGMVDQGSAVATNKGAAAEYALYGSLSSIVKQQGGTEVVYYKFTLKLQSQRTQIVGWIGEKEIKKVGENRLFGM